LARPLPYPAEQIRAVTLLAREGQLWLAVTAAVPVQRNDLDPNRAAGVDLGIVHPYAVVGEQAAVLISGRAIRAENYLHLRDQQAREVRATRRSPGPGQRGLAAMASSPGAGTASEARHRGRVHQAQHEAAKQVIAFAVSQRIGLLVVGDPTGDHEAEPGASP
jgi:transposase